MIDKWMQVCIRPKSTIKRQVAPRPTHSADLDQLASTRLLADPSSTFGVRPDESPKPDISFVLRNVKIDDLAKYFDLQLVRQEEVEVIDLLDRLRPDALDLVRKC